VSICDVSQPLGEGEDVVERIIDTAPVSVAKDADDRSNGIDFPPAAGMLFLLLLSCWYIRWQIGGLN
jgi:hypothetical protein